MEKTFSDTDSENAWLQADLSLILPESVMAEGVFETPGCELWYNLPVRALGLRLLRGVADPPIPIERIPGEGGRPRGRVLLAGKLEPFGIGPIEAPIPLPCHYYKKFQAIEVRFGPSHRSPDASAASVLDDFPALED